MLEKAKTSQKQLNVAGQLGAGAAGGASATQQNLPF